MRRLLIATALSAIGATATAQSNVTMYGVADMYLGYGKSGDTFKQTRLNEGGHVASQLGFRGTEDLGGGLKANFQFEMGVSMDTGAGNLPGPNLAFTRQSWLGLSGNWGSLQFGRQYTPIFRTTWRVDPFGVNSVFSPVTLWGQVDGQAGLLAWAARADNAIMYTTPSNLPVSGSLMFAPGEASAPSTSSGNYLSGNVVYSSGPLWASYAFQQRKSGTAAAPVASPSTSTAHVIAASYKVKAFRVGGSFGRQDSDVAGSPSATIMNIHGQYYITGTQSVLATYAIRNVASSDRDQNALLLGYNYDLSKRTMLYARAQFVKNKGNANVSLGGVTVAPNSGNDSRLFGVGMTHRF